MALATEDMIDQTDATNDNETDSEKSKRERVDLETLDPNEKVTLTISIPAGMKLAITKAGESETLAAAAHARNLLAQAIGYTIPDEFLEGTRERKYATPEEQKAAQKARNAEKRAETQAFLALLRKGKLSPELQAELDAVKASLKS